MKILKNVAIHTIHFSVYLVYDFYRAMLAQSTAMRLLSSVRLSRS